MYTTILHDARAKLEISIVEYCYLDMIYHLSNNPESKFKGYAYISHAKVADILGCTKQTVVSMSNRLKARGLLASDKTGKLKKTTFEYWHTVFEFKKLIGQNTIPGGKSVKKSDSNRSKNLSSDGQKSLPNNNSDIPFDNQEDLFPEMNSENETTFEKSLVANKKVFISTFEKENQAGIDIEYYYQIVSDWSDGLSSRDRRGKKTARGWLATARGIMRRDAQDKKLKMRGGLIGAAVGQSISEEDMKQFLS